MKKSKIKKIYQVTLDKGTYEEVLYELNCGLWSMDTCSDSEGTQFSICRHCYVIEYEDHKPNCEGLALIETFKNNTQIIDP